MQLEIGKRYHTRKTRQVVEVAGRMNLSGHVQHGRLIGNYKDGGYAYWADDGAWIAGHESDYDLVGEANDA